MPGIPGAITRLYDQLLRAVEDVAAESDTGYLYYKPLPSCFRREQSLISFDCYIMLKGWRWRPNSKNNKRVEIIVHAQEAITIEAPYSLTRSTVRVSYYIEREKKLEPLHSVHFDYERPTKECHPTFHAHVACDPVALEPADCVELHCEDLEFVPLRQSMPCFEYARIPTSDMTLSSVLLCLAADHIGGQFFRELRTTLHGIQQQMPQPAFDELKASLRSEDHLRSLHWFAETLA